MARGLVGAARSHRFSENLNKGRQFYSRLRDTLLAARKNLLVAEYDEYLRWLDLQLSTQLPPNIKAVSTDAEFLTAFAESEKLPFALEISWVSARLAATSREISEFRVNADALEDAIFSNNIRLAKHAYRNILKIAGRSLWGIELRIAVRQATGGLEAQKKYVERIRRKSRRGVFAYILYFISVRNEPQVTLQRFERDIIDRLDRSKFRAEVKTYLKYRLALKMPRTKDDLANVLRVAQSHSNFDLYEAFIAVIQKIVAQNDDMAALSVVRDAVLKLQGIKDWRLDKLALLLDIQRHELDLPRRGVEALEHLLSGKVALAYHRALRDLKRCPSDMDAAITAALCCTLRQSVPVQKRPALFFVDRLTALFGKRMDFERAEAELSKFAYNFGVLPGGRALQEICSLRGLPIILGTTASRRMKALNTRYLDPDELLLVAERRVAALVKALLNDYGDSQYIQEVTALRSGVELKKESAFIPDVKNILYSMRLSRLGKQPEACLEIEKSINGSGSVVDLISTVLAVRYNTVQHNLKRVVDLISKSIARKQCMRHVLDIREALDGVTWDSVAGFSGGLELPIALDLLLRESGESKTATLRWYAFDEFLKHNSLKSPSDIGALYGRFDRPMLIYFLRFVCIQSVMDLSRVMRLTSRSLSEERRKICMLLCDLDPENEEQYAREIAEIDQRLIIEEGLKQVDSSRLHVDTEAIAKWANREQRESYARYRDLLRAGIGVAEDIVILSESIAKAKNEFSPTVFEIPENEADDLLIQLFTGLKDKFLLDPIDGLDSYLSKRVRHGSILNFLRSPVEDAKLTTTRESEGGKYAENVFWLEKLTKLNPEQLSRANECFLEFADAFDKIILHLKDQILQIRSEAKPEGAFDIRVTNVAITLVRSAIKDFDDFEFYLEICFNLLWALLKPSLDRVRDYLEAEIKVQIAAAFEKLRAGLNASASTSPGFAELCQSIGDASAEVHRQIQAVSGWFNGAEANRGSHAYTIEQAITIAVESCKNGMRVFKPKIEIAIAEKFQISNNLLLKIDELIWVAFENVFRHCGLGAPWIKIIVTVDKDTITLLIKNEVAPSEVTGKKLANLQKLREEISQGAFKQRLTREGNSGLIKAASTAEYDGNNYIEFGFVGTKEFFFQVDLHTVPGDILVTSEMVEGRDAIAVG